MSHAKNDIRIRLLVTAAVLALVGCAVGVNAPRRAIAPNVVVAPAPAPLAGAALTVVGGPRLPHAKHVELGLECADCHEPDEETGEPGRPALEFCLDCHEEMEEDEEVPEEQRIANVFFRPDESPRWNKALLEYDEDILFSHKAHAEKNECADCHGEMEGTRRFRQKLYTMDGCSMCHVEKNAPNECATCHRKIRAEIAPASHEFQWETGHGRTILTAQARGREAELTCHYCHNDVRFCNDCHQNRLPSSHQVDWEHRHGREVWAAGGPEQARCTYCHREPDYCNGCHQVRLPTSHKHLWRRRHGVMARAGDDSGMARCEFCHANPTFCEKCHQEFEPRDHTALFRTRTHGLVAQIDRTRCTVCHKTDFCIRCHEHTSPRSHRGQWARRRNTHCLVCHFPVDANCVVCHKGAPAHETAPGLPGNHNPQSNCRTCHNSVGGGGAPPLPHVDPGTPCQICHN